MTKFRCSNCGTDHDLNEANDGLLHGSGTILHVPWYRQESGLNVNATVCLRCGTVHSTSVGTARGFLGLPRPTLVVHVYLPPDRLLKALQGGMRPLPPSVTNVLRDRALVPLPPVAFGIELIGGALTILAAYCEIVRGGVFDGDGLYELLRRAREPERVERLHGTSLILEALLTGDSTADEIARQAQAHYYAIADSSSMETTIRIDIAQALSMFRYYCVTRRGGSIDTTCLAEFLRVAHTPVPNDNPTGIERAASTIESYLNLFATPEDIVRRTLALEDRGKG